MFVHVPIWMHYTHRDCLHSIQSGRHCPAIEPSFPRWGCHILHICLACFNQFLPSSYFWVRTQESALRTRPPETEAHPENTKGYSNIQQAGSAHTALNIPLQSIKNQRHYPATTLTSRRPWMQGPPARPSTTALVSAAFSLRNRPSAYLGVVHPAEPGNYFLFRLFTPDSPWQSPRAPSSLGDQTALLITVPNTKCQWASLPQTCALYILQKLFIDGYQLLQFGVV